MKVFILAAGQGSRLRPLTDNIPKCLVEFNGKSLLDYQLEVFKMFGIKDITVISGYRSEKILLKGIRTIYNKDYLLCNMVKTLFSASRYFDEDDIIISYGDIIYQKEVLKSLLETDAPISVVIDQEWKKYWEIRMENPLKDAETLKISSNGNIIEIGKKARKYDEIKGQYIGLIKIKGSCVNKFLKEYKDMDKNQIYDGKDFDNMYMTSFLQYLIDSNWEVKPAYIKNGWLEFDSIKDITIYQKMLFKKELKEYYEESGYK